MLELIYKDCVLMKKNIILYMLTFLYAIFLCAAVAVARGMTGTEAEESVLVMMRMVCGILPLFMIYNLFTDFFRQDENRLWAGFAISSPVTAEGQVREKYLLWVLVCAVNLVLTYFFDSICMLITGNDISITGVVMLGTVLCSALTALDMPLMFRFGSSRGANLRVGGVLVLMAIAGLYFLFGDMSIFGDPDAIIAWIIDMLKNGVESKPLITLIVLMPYIAGLILYISYKISVMVYTRGVEEYE